ncbi:MAG: 4-phosphoerythronate dehydrogenase [Paludibacteraceae bacterium]|nr:4-phosphoerythronate dehydrogenase [Paludibacteraceae bacterium]
MKVLIDRYIPFLNGVLDPYATVEFLSPETFTPARVHDADALVIRTRTRVNRDLLAGSKVRFVATATIGFDHIDTSYCRQQGIHWTSCPGCNAQAVCDYIEEVLRENATFHRTTKQTLGIVGVGHVGSKVAAMAERLGWRVLLNDPPKRIGVPLDRIAAQCDVITFHTPLDASTYHLCDASFLAQCRPDALIVNAARGGIVDEEALLNSTQPYVLDCWENEPFINAALCTDRRALFVSCHIAGYSVEGKRNASQMCLDALCRFFGLPHLDVSGDTVQQGDSAIGWLSRITTRLKAHPECFESFRKAYALR